MKTNQIMVRDGIMLQRTDNGYFNATNALNYWNKESGQKKLMAEFTKLKGTIEFVEYLKINEDIEKPVLISTKGTFMHPLVFIDFCMWISLEFKTLALKYVLDGLVKTRHSAGDYYNEMCAAIMNKHIEKHNNKPQPMMYINEANMINEIASINKNRNEMSENELAKLTILQKVNTTLINENVGIDSRKKQLMIIAKSI